MIKSRETFQFDTIDRSNMIDEKKILSIRSWQQQICGPNHVTKYLNTTILVQDGISNCTITN